MLIKCILFASFCVSGTYSLCLDPPLSGFVDRLSIAVQVEASQIDYSAFIEDSRSCDSMQGPACHLLPVSSQLRSSVQYMNGDILTKVLGIPAHVSISISSPPEANYPPSRVNFFRGYRLIVDDIPRFTSEESVRLDPHSVSKLGPIRAQWIGSDWSYNTSKQVPLLRISQGSSRSNSIRFSQPVVFQELSITSLPSSISTSKLFLVGKMLGREVWRKDTLNPLVGAQVFSKWPGNGSIFRARVLVDEEVVDSIHVAWSDGDQTYRILSRDSLITIVPGNPENLYAVDEIVFTSPSGGLFEISSFIVSISSNPEDPGIHVIRSGGGMVFEEVVSSGAVMYSAKEMIQQRYTIKRSHESLKSFSQYLDAFTGTANVPYSAPKSVRRSFRNIVAYWIFSPSSPVLSRMYSLVTDREDLVLNYLNVNNMFSGILDHGSVENTNWFEESTRFIFWSQEGFPVSNFRGTISVKDTFEGSFTCIGSKGIIQMSMEVLSVHQNRPSDKFIEISVSLVLDIGKKISVVAEFFTNIGMLYVPATPEWKYPITLFLMKQNTFTVDMVGTVEYIGCGAAILRGTHVDESTRASIPSSSVESSPQQMLIEMLKKFNSILLKNKDAISGPRKAFQLNF